MQSLHSFCTQHNIPKTTVRRWLNDSGYDTSQGMTDKAVAAAKAHFRLEDPQPEPIEVREFTEGLSVITGNHCTAIEAPSYNGLTVDIGQFRDGEALVIDDPLDVAIKFLQAADQVRTALQTDIRAREQRLAQTREAQDAIAQKADELALEKSRYRLQAAQLDQAQTQETQALAANLKALQSLGKPQGSVDEHPA